MAGQNGYDLIREIRKLEAEQGRTPNLPAIALTAYTRDDDAIRAKEAGFQRHVAKPFEPGAFIATVADLTGKTVE
jgi:CheY-like chemotaxis protein